MYPRTLGQEKPKSILTALLNSRARLQNLAFIGSPGVGKASLAADFATAINCESYNSCGACRFCQLMAKKANPDFMVIAAQDQTIGISQINQLPLAMGSPPLVGRHRVFLIKNIEHLSLAAANAFLKFFEETPDHCLIIVTLSSEKQILPTILSRSLKVYFSYLSPEVVIDILTTKFNWSPALARAHYRQFSSGINKARIENWSDFIALRQEVFDSLLALLSGNLALALSYSLRWVKEGKTTTVLDIIYSLNRDLLMRQEHIEQIIINPDLILNLTGLNLAQSVHHQIAQLVSSAAYDLSYYANPQLVIQSLYIKIARAIKQHKNLVT